MKAMLVLTAVLVTALTTPAQITSGPAVCFALNDNIASPVQSLPLPGGGELYLGITSPSTVTIEQIDIHNGSFLSSEVISVQVFQTNGSALGAFLASGASVPPSAGWTPLFLSTPLLLVSGSTYALRLTISAGFVYVDGDANQPVPIQYLFVCGPTPPTMFPPCSSYPATGTYGARLRFRANGCGPTPYAVATQVGSGCGGNPQPTLATNVPPILGTTFPFHVTHFFGGGPIQLYWAAGPATAGVNLGIGGGCTAYLDLVSLQSLTAAGLEPLATIPVTGITNSTTINIPADPLLAGVTVTTQAVIFGLTGVPSPIGTIQITNALELTLGF